MVLLSSADLSKLTFKKIFLHEHYQSVERKWIQIRTDDLSVLIWVETVCKCYQQMTKVAASEERVNFDCDHGGIELCISFMAVRYHISR